MVGSQESKKATAINLTSLTWWQVLVSNFLERSNSRSRVAYIDSHSDESIALSF